jgi:hypothetical protein
MGNYMPVGSRVKIGSDNRAFSVLYGIDSLPFSEGKPARLIPGRRIIGTTEDGNEHTRCAISYLKGDFVSVGKHGRGESGKAVVTASPYSQKGAWLK